MTLFEKNKIKTVQFILSILVILIHSVNNDSFFQKMFSIENGIGQFAVPLFFVVSGFLFFRNVNNIDNVMVKIRNRIQTILYPYFLWNLIYYVLKMIITPYPSFHFYEVIDSAFNYTHNPTFWFMFQLILLIACSPLIFYFLKNKIFFIGLFVILSSLILLNIDIPYINEDAMIYYSTGAYASILYRNRLLNLINRKYFVYLMFISIFFFLFNTISFELCSTNSKYITMFILSTVYYRLSSAICLFYFFDVILSYKSTHKIMRDTFILYALHYMIVRGLSKILDYFKSLNFNLPEFVFFISENIIFIISPIVCLIATYYFVKIMKSKFPKIFLVLSGNRK